MPNQLNFKLLPKENSKRYYLIPHSGINAAWERNLFFLNSFFDNPRNFFVVYFVGELGAGKSYLIDCCLERAEELGCELSKIKKIEFNQISPSEQEISAFVSQYEQLKSSGGIIYIESQLEPQNLTNNPHLLSRIRLAEVCRLKFPQEAELPTLINSMLERNNLKLKNKDIDYILKRSASNPALILDFG